MLGFELCVDGEDELLFILAKNHPVFLFKELYSALVYEVGEKFAVVLAEEGRHEEVYVEAEHLLACVAEEFGDVAGHF